MNVLDDTIAKKVKSIKKFTKKHLVKIQPQGKIIDTINFDPTPAFSQGCQIVLSNVFNFDKNRLIH